MAKVTITIEDTDEGGVHLRFESDPKVVIDEATPAQSLGLYAVASCNEAVEDGGGESRVLSVDGAEFEDDEQPN